MKNCSFLKSVGKFLAITAAGATLSGVIFSCALINDIRGFEVPQKVTVKVSGSKYSVPLGIGRGMLRSHASAVQLQESIEKSLAEDGKASPLNIYEYDDFNNPLLQKYILDYSVADVPLDISEHLSNLDNMDLASLKETFSREVTIPEIDCLDYHQEKELDFNSMVVDKFGGTTGSFPIAESGGTITYPVPNLTLLITNPTYSTILFESGNLELTFKPVASSSPSADFTLKAKVSCLSESGQVISSSGDELQTVLTGSTVVSKILLPVDGVTVTKKLTFAVEIEVSGGETYEHAHTNEYNVGIKLSSDTHIKKITGLTISDSDLVSETMEIDQEFDTSTLTETLKQAKIGAGKMEYYIKVPDSWSGVMVQPVINVSGGISIFNSEFTNVPSAISYIAYKSVDLAGKMLFENGPVNITVKGSGRFYVKNATVVLSYDGDGNAREKVAFDVKTTVTEFAKAKIDSSKLVHAEDFSKSCNQILDENITKFIKEISFTKVGLKGVIDTDLPASDLKLSVNMKSETGIFNGIDVTDTVNFDGTGHYELDLSKVFDEDTIDAETGAKGRKAVLSNPCSVAFDVSMDLKSADDDSNITFTSIKPGSTYNLNFEISFDYDWYSLVLSSSVSDLEGTIDAGINLKSLLGDDLNSNEVISDILDKIKFCDDSIQGYMFVTKPDLEGLDGFSGLKGSVTIDYTGVAADAKQLYPKTGTEGVLSFVTARNSLAKIADENRVIRDITLVPASGELNGTAITNMFNVKPEAETLNYKFGMSGGDGSNVTIKKTGLEKLKEQGGTTSINISIAMVVSLELDIIDTIQIDDVFAVFGSGLENDLLGRESASEDSDYKKYADMIQLIELEYLLVNNCGFNFTAGFKATDEGGTDYIDKSIELKNSTADNWSKRSRLSLNRIDIDNMFTHYPFTPQIYMTIAPGHIVVPQNAYFGARAVLSAAVNGEYDIWGGEDENP